jgi:hypothetical protein
VRFFFDYSAKDQSLLDYKGDEFRSPQGAIEHAEAIAQDLTHNLTTNWTGWVIEVRSTEGKKFLSLAIGAPEIGAACA